MWFLVSAREGVVWPLQVVMQTQNSDTKVLRNAAVMQWHKDTQEAARLARYAPQTATQTVTSHLLTDANVHNTPWSQWPARAQVST